MPLFQSDREYIHRCTCDDWTPTLQFTLLVWFLAYLYFCLAAPLKRIEKALADPADPARSGERGGEVLVQPETLPVQPLDPLL